MTDVFKKIGWVCPICDTVNSPDNKVCAKCSPEIKETFPVELITKQFLTE